MACHLPMQNHRYGHVHKNAVSHFEMMQNSDVVFWQRRTDSLSYRAKVEVSSGNGSYLNDFKIVDSSDIKRNSHR